MQVAGIRRIGDRVEIIEVSELRPLAGDEVLLEVMAAGVGNWDEFVRTGGWDVGARPPMALGVEAAGTVMAAGQAVSDWAPGDPAMIVVAKASGTTRRSSLAMGTLRRRCGGMGHRTLRAIHAASIGGDDRSCRDECGLCRLLGIGQRRILGGSGSRGTGNPAVGPG
jgi:threonine dehydrogenase-like Zn-dependent dehydrogenase